jgi:hypothetical protein
MIATRMAKLLNGHHAPKELAVITAASLSQTAVAP